jgi:predicted metal-binding protein
MLQTQALERWCVRATEIGADAATAVGAAHVATAEWVRFKCLFGCDEPGVNRTCPPDLPPVATTRRLLDEFERGILLQVGPVRDAALSDAESRRLNDAALALERELFLAGHHKAWMMGAGPCERCACCVKGDPCPTPEQARPSMEGCGIDVFTTVRNAGWTIDVVRERSDAYRFFALVLVG